MSSRGAQKLIAIQCLRGIAVMMVVWVHAKEQFQAFREYFASPIGASGVDLFFVISGFIMVYTTYGKKTSVSEFLLRRLSRIVPLYWLCTLAIAAAALLVPHLLKSTTFDAAHLAASLAFIPWPSPALDGQLFPLLVPGWSINYEMFFYGIFAVTLWAPASYRLTLLALLLILVHFSSIFAGVTIANFYGDSIIFEFFAGAIIGTLHRQGYTPQTWTAGGVFIIAGMLYWGITNAYGSPDRFTGAGIAAVLIVLGACSQRPKNALFTRLFRRLGDASFSIYIFHVFLLGAIRLAWSTASLPTTGEGAAWAFMLFSLLINSLVGWHLHKLIELPLTKAFSFHRPTSKRGPVDRQFNTQG